jgi:hypothetical protein
MRAATAKSLRAQSDGKVLVTDGPYLETKEHIGGFSVVEAANLYEVLAWARRAPSLAGYRSRCAKFGDPTTTEGCARLQCWSPRSIGETHAAIFGCDSPARRL